MKTVTFLLTTLLLAGCQHTQTRAYQPNPQRGLELMRLGNEIMQPRYPRMRTPINCNRTGMGWSCW